MDKSEYKLRAEEIKELISNGEYAQAAEIADTIDWRRVKSVMMLCTISDLYKINRRYEDARDMLLLAYERRPGGRTICYSLCELSIKMEEYVQAIEYYKEFVQVAPKDPGRYILQYKLYEAQDVSLEERIAVLEELKKRDYREKWAYELAYLYHRVGLAARCVEECDELILWFGEGKYVIKAMELKMLHQPLTPEQQEKYDHRLDAPGTQQYSQNYAQDTGYTQDGDYDPNQGYAQDGSYDPNQGYVQDGNYDQSQGYGQYGNYDPNQGYIQDENYAQDQSYAQDGSYDPNRGYARDEAYDQVGGDTRVFEPVQPQPQVPAQPEEDDFDIHVKTVDVGQYNTINLQAELAAGLREVLGDDSAKQTSDSITRSIVAPMMDSDTESLDYPEISDVSEDDLEPETEQMEGSEVFFGETGEIGDLSQLPKVETEEILPEEPVISKSADVVPELSDVQKMPKEQEASEEQKTSELPEEPEATKPQEIHEVTPPMPAIPVMPVEPPKELANVLAQESDGQISLVMPEAESIEKQITGQMNIEDILAEWERKKKENLEKREEEVRQHVLQQTGAMFTEFEQSVRDGLLEQLEKEKAADTADTEGAADSITDTDEVEELEEITEESATEEPVEETTEAVPAEEPAQEPAELSEEETGEDTVEELEEEPAYAPEEVTEETEEPENEAEIYEPEEIIDEEETEPEETTDAEPVEESTEEPEQMAGEEAEEEEITEEPEAAEEPEEAGQPERPAVERDKAKVRALTREERELYAPFIQSKSAREQLVKAIDNISLAAYTGNVIITGEEGMDTLSLAKNMIREIQAEDSNFSGKVAKISGHALNKKDTADTLSRLKNGALIICKASEMNDATVNALHKALQQESQGIVIILEDTRKDIDKFLEKHEKLRESFTARMDVEALSNDTLVAFGRQYAREMEYSIDELGVLALHTRIEDMQTIDHVVTVVDVKEIVDEAIYHANRKTLKHFFDILFAKRYDDEDMIILTEKDFV